MELDTVEMMRSLPAGAWICVIAGVLILWAAFWSVFCVIFQRNLRTVPAEHRKVSNLQIWLLVVFPLSLLWMFIVLPGISASWRSWSTSRGDTTAGQCGLRTGWWASILGLVSNLLGLQPLIGGGPALTLFLQVVSFVTGLVGFIFLIAFCVIINDLKLKATQTESA